jgi:hypothetical protein
MSFVKRSRIVSIRVTEEEYLILDRISRRRGANSVSEYVRQIIASAEFVVSAPRRGIRDVTEEIEDLKRKLERLSRMVMRRTATRSSRDATWGGKEPEIGDSEERLPLPPVSVEVG